LVTGAIGGRTSESTVDRFGFSLDHLKAAHLYVLPISDWLVYDTSHWLSMLFLVLAFALPLEWLIGHWQMLVTYSLGSWIGTTAATLLIWLIDRWSDWDPEPNLRQEADIGGSVGAWTCAGAVSLLYAERFGFWIWPVRAAMLAYLGYQLIAIHGSADVAHAFGFVLGTLVAWLYLHRSKELASGRAVPWSG
jgi:hypothetical protein